MISIIAIVIWVGIAVIGSNIIVSYVLLWMLGAGQSSQPIWSMVHSALTYSLALLLIISVPKLLAKTSFGEKRKHVLTTSRKELGLRDWPTWTDIGLAGAGYIAYLFATAGVSALFRLFPWFDVTQTQNIGFNLHTMGSERIVAFITLVINAPIAEEIIFRGWLYGKLRENTSRKMSNTWSTVLSVLLTSLLFGIVHLQWNVGVDVFALSIVLCGLREITGTSYAGILLHMLKNGLAFYMIIMMGI